MRLLNFQLNSRLRGVGGAVGIQCIDDGWLGLVHTYAVVQPSMIGRPVFGAGGSHQNAPCRAIAGRLCQSVVEAVAIQVICSGNSLRRLISSIDKNLHRDNP